MSTQNARALVGDNVVDIAVHERYDAFVTALTAFANAKRRIEDGMSRAEFLLLDSIGKLFAMKQALLDNTARLYAIDKSLDVGPALLLLVTVLSDNNRGYCDLAVARMAAFLSRSPRTIHRSLQELRDAGMIFSEPVPGSPTTHSPYINRHFGFNQDSLAWLVDVYAPATARGAPGRPRKMGLPLAVTPISEMGRPRDGNGSANRMADKTTLLKDTTNNKYRYRAPLPSEDVAYNRNLVLKGSEAGTPSPSNLARLSNLETTRAPGAAGRLGPAEFERLATKGARAREIGQERLLTPEDLVLTQEAWDIAIAMDYEADVIEHYFALFKDFNIARHGDHPINWRPMWEGFLAYRFENGWQR